jgi:hypothetical protein
MLKKPPAAVSAAGSSHRATLDRSMKNLYGLFIAAALGAAAFVLNWIYLNQRAQERELVGFVALSKDIDRLDPGDRLQMDHFVKVEIPRNHIGDLEHTGFAWESRQTLVNMRINQEIIGGHLILRNYVETPLAQGKPLAKDEYTLPVPVDSRTFVSRWYKAGDFVWFGVERPPGVPTPAGNGGSTGADQPGTTEILGGATGFEVWAVGERISSQRVAAGTRQAGSHQNVLHVIVKMDNGQVDPKDRRLVDLVTSATQPRIIVFAQPPSE